MSYYQGDYYRGDYYRGDPGFFGFLGGLAKKALGFIPGVGPALSAGASMIGGGGGKMVKAGGALAKMRAIGSGAGKLLAKHPVLTAAAGAGAIGMGAGAAARSAMGAGRTGGLGRRRRMRVTNPKALRRAIRRAEGFSRLAKRVLRFTSPRAPRGRAVFKKIRRARKI